MATTDDIKQTIADYVARFSANDRAGWLALFTEDATVEDPVGAEVKRGQAELGEFWDFVHSLSDSLELRLVGPVAVVGHEGAFAQRIVTSMGGAKLAVDAIDVMTFAEDARITSMRAFWDMREMAPIDE